MPVAFEVGGVGRKAGVGSERDRVLVRVRGAGHDRSGGHRTVRSPEEELDVGRQAVVVEVLNVIEADRGIGLEDQVLQIGHLVDTQGGQDLPVLLVDRVVGDAANAVDLLAAAEDAGGDVPREVDAIRGVIRGGPITVLKKL